MNIKQLEELLNEYSKKGIKPGLERSKKLFEICGGCKSKIIHIAGTNGKGSVGAFIANTLYKSGYRVLHFSSPKVFSFKDIYRINGCVVSDKELIKTAEFVIDAAKKNNIDITEFELESQIAFTLSNSCDFAVIECGMGGRYDATNVCPSPFVSVITPVAKEHTDFLGNTLSEIAFNKAGIIKNSQCFSSFQEEEVKTALLKESKNISFTKKEDIKNIVYKYGETCFDYKNSTIIKIGLNGVNQCENAALAVNVLEYINTKGYNLNIRKGLSETYFPCRFEIIAKEPIIVLDGAHNPHSTASLCKNADLYFPDTPKTLVMGVFKDKDHKKMLSLFSNSFNEIYPVDANGKRALSSKILEKEAGSYFKKVIKKDSLEQTVKEVCSKENNIVVFAGSFSFLSDVKKLILKYTQRHLSVMENSQYKQYVSKIKHNEESREFCKHNLEHFVDVARLTYILTLENNIKVKKDIVYAAALLHDIGRAFGKDGHALKSASVAVDILKECNYNEQEIDSICDAIKFHGNKPDKIFSLTDALSYADKISRNCFDCSAIDVCYWDEDKKNKNIFL